MNNGSQLHSLIGRENSGKKVPALQLVRKEPEVAAAISKLVKPRDNTTTFLSDGSKTKNLNDSQLQAVADTIKGRIEDNENIMQVFPDIELAVQILISSVLSPKDMVKTDIIYKQRESLLPSSVILKLTDVIKSHFEGYYEILNELQDILRDALFTSGSYIKAVIPESVVDQIVNSKSSITTESLSELFVNGKTVQLGILGPSGDPDKGKKASEIALERLTGNRKVTTEETIMCDGKSFATEGLLEVSDNFFLLKLPLLNKKAASDTIKTRVSDNVRTAIESSKLSNIEFSNLVYKSGSGDTSQVITLPGKHAAKRKSIGRPLTMRIPSESTIPVFTPGSPNKHVGYFVLIDASGNPISANSEITAQSSYGGLDALLSNSNQQQQNSLGSSLIQRAKANLINKDNSDITLTQIVKAYGEIIETDLVERLKNGIYQSELLIGGNEEIYKLMLSRTLANKYCRLVYIPEEYITYFAFKYFKNGIGKSYLDDLKVLTSLRSILLFSKIMAQVKSSINLTHVNVTLDPKDPDPQKTIEIAQHEVSKLRQNYFPLGINSPIDITDWIQKAGIEFSYEGHPGLPETKFDFETKNLQHTVPDSELDELLRKQTYMALGLSPETIDNGFNSEFATTVVSNNILLAKRISQLQDRFSALLSDYAKKVINNDSIIIRELKEVIRDNKDSVIEFLTKDDKRDFNEMTEELVLKDIVDIYVENLILEFPKPDETSLDNQTEAFTAYSDALDKVIDHWISSDFITSDLVGEINTNIDTVKNVLKSYFIRKWQAENNYMNELADIVTSNDDGKPSIDLFEINKNHVESITRSILTFMKDMKPIAAAADKDVQNLGITEGTLDTSSDSSSGSDTGGGDFGGGLDFGMDDLNPGGDTGTVDNTGTGDQNTDITPPTE